MKKLLSIVIVAFFLFGKHIIAYAQCGHLPGFVLTTTDHFVICYEDTIGEPHYATPDYINNVATIAEEVWTYVITNQGYKRPPNVPETPANDDEKVRIEVRNIDDYGYTSKDEESSTYRPTITGNFSLT